MHTTPDDTRTHLPGSAGPDETRAAADTTQQSSEFRSGAIVAGRYRLIALLGRGGMGAVYRADDLTLDQPVALKFLPGSVASDEQRLTQFHNELRIARQISHKNVCRLYDLGEAGGHRFITMEYVDGEDLSSLLRRIGRIAEDKAVEIARQLCAGVAAAHERGVLHRDLKPANVMLDGNGQVRLTDFGIATTAAGAPGDLAGTPAYMAPEQLQGRPASIKSDIYALGLILFEIFTGRRATDGKTPAEIHAFHQTGTLTTPSSIVRDINPAIERVILRCLDKDPERRPSSALTVAAALPGADPLAAALAAGETPSPAVLAAAGETEAIRVGPASALVAASLLGLIVLAALSSRTSIPGRVPFRLPPAVLAERADEIARSFGHVDPAADSSWGFVRAPDYTGWLFRTRLTPDRYAPVALGRPSAVLFWHRTAPASLLPARGGRVSLTDPPSTMTGMRTVVLDGEGRLQEFRVVPPQFDERQEPAAPPAWERAFDAAGLDITTFVAAAPVWSPRDYADARAAWTGTLMSHEPVDVRVEASAYRGTITAFSIVGPWTRPTLMAPRQLWWVDRAINGFVTVMSVTLLLLAALIARANLKSNRADRRGAARIAAFIAISGLVAWLVGADHSTDLPSEFDRSWFPAASQTALLATLICTIYLALEPYVRRLWPDSLLGWSRLVAGHVRDPRVGRDLLWGSVAGVALALIDVGRATILPWLGHQAPSPPYGLNVDVWTGPGTLIAAWTIAASRASVFSLLWVLLLVLVRLALRRPWLAIPATVVMLASTNIIELGTTNTSWVFVFPLLAGSVLTAVLYRSGLLAFTIAWAIWSIAAVVPMRSDLSHWSASAGNWTVALVAGVALFGFYAARAGRPAGTSLIGSRSVSGQHGLD